MNLKTLIFIILILITNQKISAEPILNEQNIKNNWDVVSKFLNKQKIVRIYQQGISESTMIKILQLPFNEIQQLHFEKQIPKQVPQNRYKTGEMVLTHQHIKTIFTSSYFERLNVLNLRNTFIDDRHFRFLKNLSLKTSLKQLNLNSNFIGKEGLSLLSNIDFKNLTKIYLTKSFLKQKEAVDALILILCGSQQKGCKNNIEVLQISKSCIMRSHLVRLLNRLNAQYLKQLDLSLLDLTYRKTYKDGFDYSAFESFTRFNNLTVLKLGESHIDDQIAIKFENWYLPYLRKLILNKNYLTDMGIIKWINKKNIPNLQQISLDKNEIGDETIYHFIKQKYQFIKLSIGHCRITIDGMQKLSELNLCRIQSLKIALKMPTQIFNKIIDQGCLTNLKSLTMISNDFFNNIFMGVNWHKLTKLQYLRLQQIGIRNSFLELVQSQKIIPIIPNLKYLILIQTGLNNLIQLFAPASPIFFPALTDLIIKQHQYQFFTSNILGSYFKDNTYIQIGDLSFMVRSSRFQIISLPSIYFILSSDDAADMSQQGIATRIPSIVNKFEFKTIRLIQFQSKKMINIFFKILSQASIFQLPYLNKLIITPEIDIQFLINSFSDMQFPQLRQLYLKLVVPADIQDEQIQSSITPFLQKFNKLNHLLFTANFLNQQKGFYQRKKMFDSLYYPYLTFLQISDQNLQFQEIQNFLILHNHTIRSLNVENNFMQKNFINLLGQNEYTLVGLNLGSNSLQIKQFRQLGKLNTVFLSIFYFPQCDLTDEHILEFIQQKGDRPVFPNLQMLILIGNDIRSIGLKALLESQMQSLLIIDLDKNSNPQFINLLMTYPTRIALINIMNIEIYGISDLLDPTSARTIQQMTLYTPSLIRQDFTNLARLNFLRLDRCLFQIRQIYDCEILIDIMKIMKQSQMFMIQYLNQKIGLNSSCLQKIGNFQSRLYFLQIQDIHGLSYTPQFTQAILNTTSHLKILVLLNTRYSGQVIQRIFNKNNLNEIEILALVNNYIGDQYFTSILNSNFNNLAALVLKNIQITDISVQKLCAKNYASLVLLDLSSNSLTVKSIQAISKMENNKIQGLMLNRCDLTVEALYVLVTMQAKNLMLLQLNYNNFQQFDIIEFVTNLEHLRLVPNLRGIKLKGISLSKASYDAITQILNAKQIQYELDKPQNIMKTNSAKY